MEEQTLDVLQEDHSSQQAMTMKLPSMSTVSLRYKEITMEWDSSLVIMTYVLLLSLLLGLPRLPKWGHLKNLHKAIMLSENMLIGGEHRNFSLGPSLEVDYFRNKALLLLSKCSFWWFIVSIFRLMCTQVLQEAALRFCQTLMIKTTRRLCFKTWHTTYLLGQLAFYLTAKTRFSTLQR